MSLETWLAFVIVWIGITLIPGPNAAYAVGTAMTHGLPKAFMVPVGFGIAAICHVLIVSLGVGTLLLASAELFTVVKWLGVAYLFWLGIRQWRAKNNSMDMQIERGSINSIGLAAKACIISLSNPKAIYSFLAIFPQFISPQLPVAPQLIVLGATASGIAFLMYCVWTALAAPLGRWLAGSGRLRALNRTTGSLYIAGAAGLAVSEVK